MTAVENGNGIVNYRSIKDTVRLGYEWADLPFFLGQQYENYDTSLFTDSQIFKRFQKIKTMLPGQSADLGDRAVRVLNGVHKLVYIRQTVQGFPHVPRQDADLIQTWVDTTIKGEELPILAEAMFPEWVSRLDEAKDIPHITQANLWVAHRIGEYLEKNEINSISGIDAGAGTGKTLLALRKELRLRGITGKLTGIEIAHDLAERAKKNLKKGAAMQAGIRERNIIGFLEISSEVPDGSQNIFTMVYVIHHLSSIDQKKLLHLIYRKLKPGGVLVIADPTGRSNFNLTSLLINEPEAVFASFNKHVRGAKSKIRSAGFLIDEGWRSQGECIITRPVQMIDMPSGTSLKSREQGGTLYQGLLGYGIFATKPK